MQPFCGGLLQTPSRTSVPEAGCRAPQMRARTMRPPGDPRGPVRALHHRAADPRGPQQRAGDRAPVREAPAAVHQRGRVDRGRGGVPVLRRAPGQECWQLAARCGWHIRPRLDLAANNQSLHSTVWLVALPPLPRGASGRVSRGASATVGVVCEAQGRGTGRYGGQVFAWVSEGLLRCRAGALLRSSATQVGPWRRACSSKPRTATASGARRRATAAASALTAHARRARRRRNRGERGARNTLLARGKVPRHDPRHPRSAAAQPRCARRGPCRLAGAWGRVTGAPYARGRLQPAPASTNQPRCPPQGHDVS